MLGGQNSRENLRWAESKVYSRKSQNKSSSNRKSQIPPLLPISDDVNFSHDPSSDENSSSLNRPIQTLINRNHSNRHNRMDTICLTSRSREESRVLRRKLAAELDLVRAMVRKVEAREIQSSSGYTISQLSASDPNPVLDRDNEKKRTPKMNQYYRKSDFLKMGEKKHKVNGNNTVAMGEIDRSGIADPFDNCRDLLSKLMNQKHSWVFNVPVDVKKLNIPDYHSIIKRPMDLGTIRSRLNKNWYKSPGEFAEDVRLTFKNAMMYNPKGQDVHHMAEQLLNMFEEGWVEIQYLNSSNPSSLMKKMNVDLRSLERSDSTAHVGRPTNLKKPKAKDPNKRDMSFEEKRKLSTNLQILPPEKLENIVQIIKKRNTSVSQNDDEIEVDIDSVDVETLWELDRFVTNYKKGLSKSKRMEKIAILERIGVESNVNEKEDEVIADPKLTGEHREGMTVMDEKETSLGSRIREESKGGGGSRSNSSNSSSSDSGSSSGDSDGESSSACGSDRVQLTRP